jgi:hypothetical protein
VKWRRPSDGDHTVDAEQTIMNYEISYMTGVKVLKPIEYRVTAAMEGPWWWRQTRYYVESEFVRLGSFDTRREAETVAARMQRC